MKKYSKYVLFWVIICCFTLNVKAASNPYPKYEESLFGGKIINCTWYAWDQAHKNAGVDLPLWTYVQKWYSKAKKAGYSVGKEPKVNSIMVWDYGEGFGGHVAYVTGVNGNKVTFNEGGSPMTKDGIYVGNSMTMEEMSSFLVGFIYLDNVPKTTTTKKKTTTKKTPTATTTTSSTSYIKSSNNYLSELDIKKTNIDFNREILEYTVDVKSEVETITIDAKAEDSKSTISGIGTFPLINGQNTFIVSVTAEDSSTKDYQIIINRLEKATLLTQPTEEKKKEQLNIDKKKIIIISIASVLTIILISVIAILLIKRKRSSK